jgi:hypothetical protein
MDSFFAMDTEQPALEEGSLATSSYKMIYTLLMSFLLPYLGFHAAHFISANIYAYVCANPSLYGYVMSLVSTGSPMCTSILNVMHYTSHGVTAVLFASAASFLTLLGSCTKRG